MREYSATPKLPKRIRLGKLPYVLGIGGAKESKDMKLMFIEKVTGKHYTIRIISDQENGRFTFDIHATDEEKKHAAIREGRSPGEAYDSLIRMTFDLKALSKDGEAVGQRMVELASKYTALVDSNDMFRDKAIIPILRDNSMVELKKGGKEGHIDDEKLMKLVQSIQGVEDLDKYGFTAGTVRTTDRRLWGAVFKREGKWYYMDMAGYAREALLLIEPYLTIEGKMSKEEFIGRVKSDLPALPGSL